MVAVNRCQGFYWLRIYHLTDGAICAPLNINKSQINQIVSQIFNPTSSRLLTSLAIGLLLAPLILNTYASQG